MPSETYIPVGRVKWFGTDKRIRCVADDKVVFGSREDAERSADRAKDQMKAYLGKCGHWHTTRVKSRPPRGL